MSTRTTNTVTTTETRAGPLPVEQVPDADTATHPTCEFCSDRALIRSPVDIGGRLYYFIPLCPQYHVPPQDIKPDVNRKTLAEQSLPRPILAPGDTVDATDETIYVVRADNGVFAFERPPSCG